EYLLQEFQVFHLTVTRVTRVSGVPDTFESRSFTVSRVSRVSDTFESRSLTISGVSATFESRNFTVASVASVASVSPISRIFFCMPGYSLFLSDPVKGRCPTRCHVPRERLLCPCGSRLNSASPQVYRVRGGCVRAEFAGA